MFNRQRPDNEHRRKPSAVELFSRLKGPEEELEKAACATLKLEEVGGGFPVAEYVKETLQGKALNADKMLLAVHLADGKHKGRLVWKTAPDLPLPKKRQVPQKMAPVSTQRRGQGVGGGVC